MTKGRVSPRPRTAFGEKLLKARRAQKITQKEISKLLNMTQSGYATWERETVALRPDQIKKLCKILDVTPNYLYDFPPATSSASKRKGKK